jgi:hypothetical protein
MQKRRSTIWDFMLERIRRLPYVHLKENKEITIKRVATCFIVLCFVFIYSRSTVPPQRHLGKASSFGNWEELQSLSSALIVSGISLVTWQRFYIAPRNLGVPYIAIVTNEYLLRWYMWAFGLGLRYYKNTCFFTMNLMLCLHSF